MIEWLTYSRLGLNRDPNAPKGCASLKEHVTIQKLSDLLKLQALPKQGQVPFEPSEMRGMRPPSPAIMTRYPGNFLAS